MFVLFERRIVPVPPKDVERSVGKGFNYLDTDAMVFPVIVRRSGIVAENILVAEFTAKFVNCARKVL